MRDDFSFEDTAPDGKPLKRGRRLTFTAFIRDIIALAMLVFVLYFLYFAGYTYYRYDYMKEKVRNAALYATKTDDDRKIIGHLSSYCMADKEFFCRPDYIKVDRNFDEATVEMKFKYKFLVLGKYPVILTFKPKVKMPIE